jgi:hypothetical protein
MVMRRDFRIQLPDEPGQLARICDALSVCGINIRTLAGIAGSPPILALITDNDEETRRVLHALDLSYEETDLLVIHFNNNPGEIAVFSTALAEEGINVSAVYMLGGIKDKGVVAFGVSDIARAQAIAARFGNGID